MGKKIVNFFNKILGLNENKDIIGLTSFEHSKIEEPQVQTKLTKSNTSFTGMIKRA